MAKLHLWNSNCYFQNLVGTSGKTIRCFRPLNILFGTSLQLSQLCATAWSGRAGSGTSPVSIMGQLRTVWAKNNRSSDVRLNKVADFRGTHASSFWTFYWQFSSTFSSCRAKVSARPHCVYLWHRGQTKWSGGIGSGCGEAPPSAPAWRSSLSPSRHRRSSWHKEESTCADWRQQLIRWSVRHRWSEIATFKLMALRGGCHLPHYTLTTATSKTNQQW